MSARVITGNCLEVLPTLDAESVDAIVSDPPYGLGFMGKGWDHAVPVVEFWREALRVAKPGAHLAAFGGTRTYHRLACAIEDAGWEIRDCLSWLYGSGFPKSLDVSKAVDKHLGATPHIIGTRKAVPGVAFTQSSPAATGRAEIPVTVPATDAGHQWQGYGTALKPGYEPIILAQKPYAPQHLLAILAHTTTELLWLLVDSSEKTATPSSAWLQTAGFWSTAPWLSECLGVLSQLANRCTIETASGLITDLKILKSSLSKLTPSTTTVASSAISGDESSAWLAASISRSVQAKCERLASTTAGEIAIDWRADEGSGPEGSDLAPAWEPIILARKPLAGTVAANVLQYGTGGLNIDGCRVGEIGGPADLAAGSGTRSNAVYGTYGAAVTTPLDKGRWPANVVLDEAAAGLLDAQSGISKGGTDTGRRVHGGLWSASADGIPCGPQYGDSGGASRFFYTAKASRSEREAGLDHLPARITNTDTPPGTQGATNPRAGANRSCAARNHHPTVKPLALMQWLCRLVTPPGGLILDPFCGSGTTGRAAVAEGFRFIGIELSEEYAAIARARIAEYAPLFADNAGDAA